VENKGQSILMGVIIGVMLFLVGMVFLNFITPEHWIDGSDSMLVELGCGTVAANGTIVGAAAGISDGVKATCLIGEIIIPYFIVLVISAVGGIVLARFLL
jgi:hypothetical protein